MSMLSAQVDRLRELATGYDELQAGAVKAVTMPSDMGSILHEAADTIWQLRDDLQRANAENAKLRERSAKTLEVGTRWMAKAARFESENTKLRELVADMWFWHYEGHIDSESQEHQMLHIDGVLNRMHELGVEVGK